MKNEKSKKRNYQSLEIRRQAVEAYEREQFQYGTCWSSITSITVCFGAGGSS